MLESAGPYAKVVGESLLAGAGELGGINTGLLEVKVWVRAADLAAVRKLVGRLMKRTCARVARGSLRKRGFVASAKRTTQPAFKSAGPAKLSASLLSPRLLLSQLECNALNAGSRRH